MNDLGITISKVAVTGSGKPDATLVFAPGLNVVAGASNTGKTYAWQLIDFLLGAAVPKDHSVRSGIFTCLHRASLA